MRQPVSSPYRGALTKAPPRALEQRILGLQRTAGNAAVTALLQRRPPSLAPAPPVAAPAETADVTRKAAVSFGRQSALAVQFGPVLVGGRMVKIELHLRLKGTASGLLPPALPRAKGKKGPPDPAEAAARASILEAMRLVRPVVSGPQISIDLGGQLLFIVVSDMGATKQAVLSSHSVNKTSLSLGGIEFVGSAYGEVMTTVEGGGTPGEKSEYANDAVARQQFLGVDAVLQNVYETVKGKQVLKAERNVAAADPAMVAKVLKLAKILESKEQGERHAMMAHVMDVTKAKNAEAKKPKSDADVTQGGKAAGEAAVRKAQWASERFEEGVDTTFVALKLLERMRPWFGSDEATIAHYATMRRVKGQPNLVVAGALADRLEAVQQVMQAKFKDAKAAPYPQTDVGWSFRSEIQTGAHQTHKSMHMIGMAVDFDAYNLPMMNPGTTKALVRAVTGRTNRLFDGSAKGPDYRDYGKRRSMIRSLESGDMTPEKEQFLVTLSESIDSLVAASDRFRESLNQTGGQKAFSDVREAYGDATEMPDGPDKTKALAAVDKRIGALINPWIVKLADYEKELIKEASDKYKIDISQPLPDPKPLKAVMKPLGALNAKLAKKPDAVLSAKETATVSATCAALNEPLPDPVTAADVSRLLGAARASLAKMDAVITPRQAKGVSDLDAELWYVRETGRLLGSSKKFLFGTMGYRKDKETGKQLRTWSESVDQPGAGQVFQRGWFRVADPGTTRATPSKEFILEMASHGFELGASWGSSDSMHFEIAVK